MYSIINIERGVNCTISGTGRLHNSGVGVNIKDGINCTVSDISIANTDIGVNIDGGKKIIIKNINLINAVQPASVNNTRGLIAINNIERSDEKNKKEIFKYSKI